MSVPKPHAHSDCSSCPTGWRRSYTLAKPVKRVRRSDLYKLYLHLSAFMLETRVSLKRLVGVSKLSRMSEKIRALSSLILEAKTLLKIDL